MALLLPNVELETGLHLTNVYARIETVNGGKLGAEICLKLYVSKELYNDGKLHVKQIPYNFSPSVDDNSLNFIKQGYEYLKALPEFAEAIDA